jgi:hypothetical protein
MEDKKDGYVTAWGARSQESKSLQCLQRRPTWPRAMGLLRPMTGRMISVFFVGCGN